MSTSVHTFISDTKQPDVDDTEDDTLEEVSEQIASIKGQLYSIMSRFRSIVRHSETTEYGLEDDLEMLQDMDTELDAVNTRHPYCSGCNSTGGGGSNQMAHMYGGCFDDENKDIEEMINTMLKKKT